MFDHFFQVIKDAPGLATVSAAFIAASATLFTLLLGSIFSEISKKRTRRLELAITRVDDQIGKFYAPLSILITQLLEIDQIKRKITEQDAAHAAEIEKIAYDTYFSSIHDKINDILRNQMHLLEAKGIPDCFDEYYKHVASEKVLYSLRQLLAQQEVQIGGTFTVVGFPMSFKDEIEGGSRKVQQRQEDLFRLLDKRRTYG